MRFYLNAFLYNLFIDPLLSGLKQTVAIKAGSASKVIDIACGTGTLACAIAGRAGHVTGIDLDEGLISFASHRALKKRITNTKFEVHDATGLSTYQDREFDVAVTSMSVHQFNEEPAIKILSEMKRIARKVIIADYNCPLRPGFSSTLTYGIERMAKGDHYRNFRNYMERGGIRWFTDQAGLFIKSESARGYGVFVVVVCE